MIWSCGCETWKDGNTFHIKPCSKSCPVYKITIEESKKRGNLILEKII